MEGAETRKKEYPSPCVLVLELHHGENTYQAFIKTHFTTRAGNCDVSIVTAVCLSLPQFNWVEEKTICAFWNPYLIKSIQFSQLQSEHSEHR